MRNLKNSLINERSVNIACISFVILEFVAVIAYALSNFLDSMWVMECIILIVMCIGLTKSYFKHAKNVMKPLIGAILMFYLYYFMRWSVDYLEYSVWKVSTNDTLTPWEICITVSQIVLFVFIILININHYRINYTHLSSPKLVKCNQILLVASVVVVIIQCIALILYDFRFLAIVSNICVAVADIVLLGLIVIIESLLDGFRQKREANTEREK